jgi:hypothetical protein
LVLHTYILTVQYSCGVLLVFWFWREIVFGVTYVFSVQYSCTVVSVFWLWREIVFKMRTRFYKKSYWVTYYDPLADVCISQDLTLFYSVSFYIVYFSCTAQIHKLKFKSEIYLTNFQLAHRNRYLEGFWCYVRT